MALFRILCIRYQAYFSSLGRLMVTLQWLQLALFLLVWITCYEAALYYGSSSFYEFCRGYTTKVRKLIFYQILELVGTQCIFMFHSII